MYDAELKHDVSEWNIDGFDLRRYEEGKVDHFPLDPTLGEIEDIFHIRVDQIVVARSAQMLQLVDLGSRSVRTIYIQKNPTGKTRFSVSGETLYVLDPQTAVITAFKIDGGACGIVKSWTIPKALDPKCISSFCVKRSGREMFLAHDCGIAHLDLDSGLSPIAQLSSDSFAGSPLVLGDRSSLQLDERSGTLLVTDPNNNRVLEIDLYCQTIASLWSVSSVGMEMNLGVPPVLGGPQTAVAYHIHDHVDRSYLTHDSRRILNANPTLPRAVIVADTKNCCVRKRMDFPSTPRLLRFSGKTLFTNLIGSGHTPDDLDQELQTAPREDLRKWAIGPPVGLSVGPAGDLAISLSRPCSLLLLQPASVVMAKAAQTQAQEHELDFT